MTPDSHTAACDAVARHAIERNKQFPGYKVLTGFIPHQAFCDAYPGYDNQKPIDGRELTRDMVEFLQETDDVTSLVAGLLNFLANDSAHESHGIADKILNQIKSDLASSENGEYRKPVHYVAGADEGIALALVIDDRFWTDEW